MRIWDIDPGYLNDQSLLGEHRELHGIVSILSNNKKGYSRHPETLRWKGHGWALRQRHQLLKAEMSLRGFNERTPLSLRSNKDKWPDKYIDNPGHQYSLLRGKYINKNQGRIPIPKNTQEIWAQHKYSVMARDPKLYKSIGRTAAGLEKFEMFEELSDTLVSILRTRPSQTRTMNSLQHMWGYVSGYSVNPTNEKILDNQKLLLMEIQKLSKKHNIKYLLHSTALSEIGAWI